MRLSAIHLMISAIIRTRNSGATLRGTLDSLVTQTLPPTEIIIVDNDSNDETLAIAAEYKAVIVPYDREVFNYSYALNLGLLRASQPWALILSSHVIFTSNQSLRFIMDEISMRKSCFGGYFKRTEQPLQEEGAFISEEVDRGKFRAFNGLCNYASVIDRKLWLEEPFDESLPCCEDQIWAYKHMVKGFVGVSIIQPAVFYSNPYFSLWKEARDALVVVRQKEISFGRRQMAQKYLRIFVIGLLKLNFRDMQRAAYVQSVLVRDLFVPYSLASKYF